MEKNVEPIELLQVSCFNKFIQKSDNCLVQAKISLGDFSTVWVIKRNSNGAVIDSKYVEFASFNNLYIIPK